MPDYYRLDDGRIWSVKAANFISKDVIEVQDYIASGQILGIAPDEKGNLSEDGLRQTLIFYNLPLGVLITLDEAKTIALTELSSAFLSTESSGKVKSSVKFVIDATERSHRDIDGLITSMEATNTSETMFCAADNSFHTVTLDQLRIMRLEIISYRQALYAHKWKLRSAIENAKSVDEVRTISINFDDVDFLSIKNVLNSK